MAIIVETGLEVANANSYISLADANTYFSLRNDVTWAALNDTTQKTPFLILAVDYMQQAYRPSWKGQRHTITQSLDWPRLWVDQPDAPGGYGAFPFYYSPTSIPQEIITAQCLLAKKLANGDLAPDLSRVEKMVKVGSIQVEYDTNRPPVTIFRDVSMLLSPFLAYSGSMVRIERS